MIYTCSLTDVQSGALFSPLGHSSPYPHPLEGKKILAFLLFFACDRLSILHEDYYQHYILLCEAIYILNSYVNRKELKRASKLLQHFYFKFPYLVRRQIYEL